MSKNNKFSGKPIISQVLDLLDRQKINRTAKENNSDYYYKTFKTIDHLITMIYVVLSGCSSLREIEGIMLACEGKINHLGIKHFPKRSTISDGNIKRNSKVFSDIYFGLYNKYCKVLSDSMLKDSIIKQLKIVDSTTISLFSDILKGVGRNPINGKKKGGIKMHTMINASEDVPVLITFTSAATHDHTFFKELGLIKGSIIVFDKGYVDYVQYYQFNLDGIYFVTRQKDNAVWESIQEFEIPEDSHNGVLKDEKIQIVKDGQTITLRRVAFWVEEQKKLYEFITNNYEFSAEKIAEIYKRRWQIELLFKRLKQNFPLKYFLGDSQKCNRNTNMGKFDCTVINACYSKTGREKVGIFEHGVCDKVHLMTYKDLWKFLKSPNSEWNYLTAKN